MTRGRIIIAILILILVIIQFIQPPRNNNVQVTGADFIALNKVPPSVEGILKKSCYDCHSNHTRYPWYFHIQPAGWLLAKHIKDGKEELNFNEFGQYSKRRQLSKLKAIRGSIKDGSMPLSSYTFLHSEAILSELQKQLIIDWTTKKIDSLTVEQ